ncbi:hypothetical protein [Sphingomonas sp. GM_Shp_2]|uniref:hypothetical protein n=1 Tax=Sphingomonas sp. GM_Shp_2 TaxID=2937380 RepID=UPI00226AE240|nr:hypothetical protein [Sphingomonas sp. GM_Shp_2]
MSLISRAHLAATILIGIALACLLFGHAQAATGAVALACWLQTWSLEVIRTALRETKP